MKPQKLRSIRRLLLFFMVMLFLSGLTAIPLISELRFLLHLIPAKTSLYLWMNRVLSALTETAAQHPFLLYGYDWLAFAHFVLSLLFIGPYKDPEKNIWVIQFGFIACMLIIPYAFTAGYFRGIPIGWCLIDCSFGIVGFWVLCIIYKKIKSISLTPVLKPSP